jgi:hypothetical protein
VDKKAGNGDRGNCRIREENEKIRTFTHLRRVVHNFARFIHVSQQLSPALSKCHPERSEGSRYPLPGESDPERSEGHPSLRSGELPDVENVENLSTAFVDNMPASQPLCMMLKTYPQLLWKTHAFSTVLHVLLKTYPHSLWISQGIEELCVWC